jgi:diguanylate cyclase (GGDEF)-like protein
VEADVTDHQRDTAARAADHRIIAAWAGVEPADVSRLPPHVREAMVARILDTQAAFGVVRDDLIEHVMGAIRRITEATGSDFVTGLPNRHAAYERLLGEIERAGRYGPPVSVLLAGVEGMEAVNDRLGHAAGNTLLRDIADRLQIAVRRLDLVGRWSADEFVVICPGTDETVVAVVADRLREASLRTPSDIAGQPRIGVTVGWAVSSPVRGRARRGRPAAQQLADAATLIEKAGRALQTSRRNAPARGDPRHS